VNYNTTHYRFWFRGVQGLLGGNSEGLGALGAIRDLF